MDKQKLINLVYWGMIAIVIATCIFVYFYLSGNANNCLTDPLKFYAENTNSDCFCAPKVALIP